MIKKIKKSNYSAIDIMIFLSLLMISIFPIFGSIGSLVQKIVVWATILFGIVYYVLRHGVVFNRFSVIYLIYIVFSCVSIIWSTKNGGAIIRIIDMTKAILFFTVIASNCKDKKDIYKYLDVYLIGVIAISIFCLIKDFSSLKTWARLGQSEFLLAGQNQIYYSCILIYATIYSFYRVINNKDKKAINITISLFLYVCGLLTAIRKCLIIPIIFLIIFFVIKNRKNTLKLVLYGVVALILLISSYKILTNYFPSMAYRIDSLISDITSDKEASTVSGNSYSSRKWLRERATEVFFDNPILGVGIGQFRYYAAEGGLDLYSHNNFLEILANTGLIGFIIYYSSYFSIIVGLIKNKLKESSEAIFIISFILAILVMEYGQVEYYQLNFIVFLGILSLVPNGKKYLVYLGKDSD